MRIPTCHSLSTRRTDSTSRRQQGGMAVIVVIALVAIILVYVAGNIRALHHLTGELRLVEKAQKQRLEAVSGAGVRTNSVLKAGTRAASKLPPAAER
jgi:hypothetical protein